MRLKVKENDKVKAESYELRVTSFEIRNYSERHE